MNLLFKVAEVLDLPPSGSGSRVAGAPEGARLYYRIYPAAITSFRVAVQKGSRLQVADVAYGRARTFRDATSADLDQWVQYGTVRAGSVQTGGAA